MITLAASTVAALILAQSPEPQPVERTECPAPVTLAMLPSVRRAPLIELTIGGKPYHFLLDTGAAGGRISPEIVAYLGLKPVGQIEAADPSGKNSRKVDLYRIPEIVAGSAKFFGVSMFADSGGPAGHADGVIGYGVFKDLLLVLDYPARKVSFLHGSLPRTAIPYKTVGGIPVLPIKIGKFVIDGHVDSGSDGGLLVPLKYKAQLPLEGEPRVIGHARTLFNSFDILGAKVSAPVTIGGFQIDVPMIEMHAMFPIGNIGARVLSLYKVTIDQKHRRIQFQKPN